MTYPAPDNIEYDPWFDDKVEPSTLLRPTRKEKLITIHAVSYTHLTLPTKRIV